ncbi:hypothetical protein [Thauera sp. WH-1]|uniref:hypothetical protein n=1 Tax=Thauera sp. WH-1 TaxID=3398230 RepID=UPI0039FDA7EE
MNARVQAGQRPANPLTPALVRCQRVMARAGWEIEYVDLDFTRPKPAAELKIMRSDGRWLWAKVDTLGRCTIETFHRERTLGMSRNQKGPRPLVPIVEDTFLGRQHPAGPRQMLRLVTSYVSDNALSQVPLPEIREAWAAIMPAPVHWARALN